MLAQVVVPTRSASRRTGAAIGNHLLLAERTHTDRTVAEDDVACEDIVIFFQVFAHHGNKFLDATLEVGMQVVRQTTNHVVVDDEAAAAGFFKNVENFLAVAESIEESRCRPQVLTQAGEEEDVRVDALQFVHDGANYLYAVAHFHAQSLLNTSTECMTALHSAQVVHTVSEGEGLRIGELFADLLYTTVDITEVWVEFGDDFTF